MKISPQINSSKIPLFEEAALIRRQFVVVVVVVVAVERSYVRE